MTEYLILIHGDEGRWDALSADERAAVDEPSTQARISAHRQRMPQRIVQEHADIFGRRKALIIAYLTIASAALKLAPLIRAGTAACRAAR